MSKIIPTPTRGSNLPLYSLGAACLFLAAAVVLTVTGHMQDNPALIGVTVTTIPSLLAASYAEKNSRDIHNGVVTQRAKEGAKQAITEAQVVTRDGPLASTHMASMQATVQALTDILKVLHPEIQQAIDSPAKKTTTPRKKAT